MTDSPCPCCAARHAAEDAARNAQAVADQQQDVLNKMRARIVAFAGQLQAWGYTEPARELLDEILIGPVNAPDYFALQIENAALREVEERRSHHSYTQDGEYIKLAFAYKRLLRALAILCPRYTEAVDALATARASHARIVALLCTERDATIQDGVK